MKSVNDSFIGLTMYQIIHSLIDWTTDALLHLFLQAWSGNPENTKKAQDILTSLAKANSEAQLGKYAGPHPAAGGGRILQALRTGGSGKS